MTSLRVFEPQIKMSVLCTEDACSRGPRLHAGTDADPTRSRVEWFRVDICLPKRLGPQTGRTGGPAGIDDFTPVIT